VPPMEVREFRAFISYRGLLVKTATMIRNRLQSLLHKHNLMLSEEGLLDQAWWEAQEQPTFTHADFKSDHLLTMPQGLTLIDFDICTLTDTAFDIGKFLADLEWWFALRRISGVEAAQEELLKGYGASQNQVANSKPFLEITAGTCL
jgi:aminoglycoside phosphotransferase (APT) family kinase protein